MSTAKPIPVVCDRCRAEGRSDEDPFAAFGALLDFEPVPRRTARADGWDAETQRAFVAALSLTGSARQAARAVGKASYGADQLLRHEESDGFRAACEQAMAIAADERSRLLAEGVRRAADEALEGRRLADPPWAKARSRQRDLAGPDAGPDPDSPEAIAAREREGEALLERIFATYLMRLRKERRARLAGQIAEADLCVRQISWLEVVLDLLSGGLDPFALERFRTERGHHLIRVAETPLSRAMDDARREHWAAHGEPDRPRPAEGLRDCGGYKLGPDVTIEGGPDWRERFRAQDAEYAAAAAAQVEWEAEALRQVEAWREANAAERNDADA